MKKRKFDARAMKKFTTEPKVVHESKPVDLITQYNRMRSIATDIYNSDFFAIATKKERKEIEASIARISATMISIIGMEAIKNSHESLPDDSGNGDDHSWDNLPDDSGDYTDTDKASHDAIEKMKNIAYGKSESDDVKKAAARQVLNSVYGATHPIMAMNRRILSELGTKSPMQIMDECLAHTDNEHDDDSDGDEVKKFEVNLGNFIDGPFYSDQYRALGIQYGFDIEPTLKQIEKLASYYYIQMINLVDVVDSQDEITADKYTLEPGSVFFITNKKDSSKSPVFILVYMQPYTKTKSFDISRFSIEITPEHHTEESTNLEESTKSHMRISPMQILVEVPSDDDSNGDDYDVDFGNFADGPFYSDQYRHICQLNGFNIDETLKRIVKAASDYTISKLNLVGVVSDKHDIKSDDKYYPNTGDVFFVTNKENDKDPVFVLIYAKSYLELFDFDIDKVSTEIKPVNLEESTKTNHIDSIGSEAYFNIGKVYLDQNTIIDLNATWEKIKNKAEEKGIKTITFVDTIKEPSDIYSGKYYLKLGSLFFATEGYPRFILIDEYPTTFHCIDPVWVFKKNESAIKSVEDNSDKDDIEFIGIDDYYNIDKSCPNSDQVIDLDATLIKIKEKAKEEGIKTITFIDTIEGGNHASDKYSYESGALFFVKNTNWVRFELLTKTDFTMFYHINPVLTFESSYNYSVNDQYADVDTSKLNHDIYAGVSFSIFMKPTVTDANVSFADICDIYGFDISETIKRIKNAAYLENIDEVKYIDSFNSFDEIFKIDLPTKYRYCDGYLFFVNDSAKDKQDPCFVILRKTRDNSEIDAILYRINPIKRPASIYCIKKIDVIDTYADGDVRIADGLKNTIYIDHAYKLKKICDKRNYNYDSIISCLKGVTAIIGGGTCLTFEGTVGSLNSIVSVDPVVAYNACSVFFVSGFVDSEKGPYFVIYVPITGKTKNGYNFHLYPIYPIPNQDPNTDSHDDSNVREINQFTTIYRANLEVSEADKDAYMKVEFSIIDYNDREIQSLANICYTWKFKFYDTIKRIRFVAYMSNFEEIKYAGAACSHEEILEKEVLYSNGSVLFVSDAEDPHFVIVEFIHGSTCLIRINPVKE